MGWFLLLWGVAVLAHGAALVTNLRGYAGKCLRWATAGLDRRPVQHFNAAAGQWRTGRAGLVPSVGMLRAMGGIFVVAGVVALIMGFRLLSAL